MGFEMFSDEGNQMCAQVFNDIKTVILGEKFITEYELETLVEDKIKEISKTHSEVYDTEPRWHLERRINEVLKMRGYGYHLGL